MNFQEAVEQQGWNDQTKISILLDFINESNMNKDLDEYATKRASEENLDEACENCSGSPIPGIIFPASPDDREEERDGKVWIQRHGECGVFDSDVEAAEALSKETGWPVMKSYDRDDEFDEKGRAEKAGTEYYRPYFAVTLNEAYDWEAIVNENRKENK